MDVTLRFMGIAIVLGTCAREPVGGVASLASRGVPGLPGLADPPEH